MNNFSYYRAESVEDTLQALQDAGDSRVLAGGTDLIPLVKDEIVSPRAPRGYLRWRSYLASSSSARTAST